VKEGKIVAGLGGTPLPPLQVAPMIPSSALPALLARVLKETGADGHCRPPACKCSHITGKSGFCCP
jgi:hypothetical protein